MSTEQTQAEHSALFAEVTRRLTRAVFALARDSRALTSSDIAPALLSAAATLATAAEGPAAAAALLRVLAAHLEAGDVPKPN